ncbi:unnamed protein product [Cunninghamella echinulata]
MSKSIVDDTLYEKILTILTTFINNTENISLFDNWNVLDILLLACKQIDQDDRVYSLCLRILGCWMTKKDNSFFLKVKTDYSFLLTLILSGLRALEAPVRCASLEACKGILHLSQGAQWLLESDDTKMMLSLSLMDDSIYVVSKGCEIYLLMIQKQSLSQEYEKLFQKMDPSNQIKQLLESYQQPISLIMAGLEYCWTMVNTCDDPIVYDYLINTYLLSPLTNLLIKVDNRIVRKRIIEILSVVFQNSSSPYHLLIQNNELENSNETIMDDNSHYFIKLYESTQMICKSMIQSEIIDDICVGIELVQANTKLLSRIQNQQEVNNEISIRLKQEIQIINQSMIKIIECCCDKYHEIEDNLEDVSYKILKLIKKAPRPLFIKKKLLQAALQTLQSIAKDFQIEDPNSVLEAVLYIFSDTSFSNDQRLLKSCLRMIIQLLHCYSAILSLDNINKVMILLIEKISDIQMDSRNLVLVLSTFNELLGHASFKTFLMQPDLLKLFMNGVQIKFVDMEWDVRDAMIEFVGKLFKPTLLPPMGIEKVDTNIDNDDKYLENKMEFAITTELPLLVIERINDHEPYVRASALNTVQLMMKTGPGWLFIQQHEKLRELSHHLPKLLYDTEGFVRRATLDAMICLVTNRSCEGLIIKQDKEVEDEDNEENKSRLGSNTFAMLMNDDDIEVRIRVCRLLKSFYELDLHEKQQYKKNKYSNGDQQQQYQQKKSYFYILNGDQWLIATVKDSQRIVRWEAVQVIDWILSLTNQTTTTTVQMNEKNSQKRTNENKSLEGEDDKRNEQFLNQLQQLDLTHIKQTIQPEHLYQEAFDISPLMMTQSIQPSNNIDDPNMLDCY